jgi:hypothetical protein
MAIPRPQPDPAQQLTFAADAVAQALDADVLFLNATMMRPLDATVMKLVRQRRRRDNVLFIIVTIGGDADVAFRIARCLQQSYKRVSCFLTGYCKSAGTIAALGANELVVADTGELGPIDAQMSKPDELIQRQSGLTATAALETLNEHAFEAFSYFLLEMVRRGQGGITTKTATHLSVQMVGGLFSTLYGHLDPMHVGEAGRALQIAHKYGEMLQAKSGNYGIDTLQALLGGYPSHGFVIDREELKRLFRIVREPSPEEMRLAELLDEAALRPASSNQGPVVVFISTERAASVAPTVQPTPLGGNAGDAPARAEALNVNNGNPGADPGTQPGNPATPDQAEAEPALAVVGS